MNPSWATDFTLLILEATKPSSEDYCRGCHMASYPSDSFSGRYKPSEGGEMERLEADLLECLSADLGTGEKGWGFRLEGIDGDGDLGCLIDDTVLFGWPEGLPEWWEGLAEKAKEAKAEKARADRDAAASELTAREDENFRYKISRAIERHGSAWVLEEVEKKLSEGCQMKRDRNGVQVIITEEAPAPGPGMLAAVRDLDLSKLPLRRS